VRPSSSGDIGPVTVLIMRAPYTGKQIFKRPQ